MNNYAKMIVLAVILLLCVFALNWAIASAFSGPGFALYALVNGAILLTVVFLAIKRTQQKA